MNSMIVAELTVHVTAREPQAVESHNDAGNLLNVMDHLSHRDCISPDLPQLFCRTGADDILSVADSGQRSRAAFSTKKRS